MVLDHKNNDHYGLTTLDHMIMTPICAPTMAQWVKVRTFQVCKFYNDVPLTPHISAQKV